MKAASELHSVYKFSNLAKSGLATPNTLRERGGAGGNSHDCNLSLSLTCDLFAQSPALPREKLETFGKIHILVGFKHLNSRWKT